MIDRTLRIALLLCVLLSTGCTFVATRPKHVLRTALHLKPKSCELCDGSFHQEMTRLTGTPSRTGNKVRLLTNGDAVFPSMITAIEAARERISLEFYIVRDDEIGHRFREALLAAIRRGVQIRFLIDAIGSMDLADAYTSPLREAGAEIRYFNPLLHWTVLRVNNRNHRKQLIVDGQVAFVGGLNLAEEYNGNGLSTGWRDTAIRVEGPAALEIEHVFVRSWKQGGGGFFGKDLPVVGVRPLKALLDEPVLWLLGDEEWTHALDQQQTTSHGDARVRAVASAPDRSASSLLDMYILAIQSAKTRVWITNSYFIPPILLSRAMCDAAERGVDVRLLTQGKTDEDTVRRQSVRTYGVLLECGVRIYEYQPAILHAKTMLVDDSWVTIGSANLDGRALFLNYEANVAVESAALAKAMIEQFRKDIKESREVTLKGWIRRPWGRKVGEFLLLPLEGQL